MQQLEPGRGSHSREPKGEGEDREIDEAKQGGDGHEGRVESKAASVRQGLRSRAANSLEKQGRSSWKQRGLDWS